MIFKVRATSCEFWGLTKHAAGSQAVGDLSHVLGTVEYLEGRTDQFFCCSVSYDGISGTVAFSLKSVTKTLDAAMAFPFVDAPWQELQISSRVSALLRIVW